MTDVLERIKEALERGAYCDIQWALSLLCACRDEITKLREQQAAHDDDERLLDRFAGRALPFVLEVKGSMCDAAVAHAAYRIADAMLAEKKRRKEASE